MNGWPLAFLLYTSRLEGIQESAVNIDAQISKAIKESNEAIECNRNVPGFVTYSPNVMVLTQKLLSGAKDVGSSCVVFAFGCICHGISNLAKDLYQHPVVKEALARTVKLARFFCNTHAASDLLDIVSKEMKTPVRTVKSYSTATWNGVANLFEFVLDNKKPIGEVYTSQQMALPSDRVFDLRPNPNLYQSETL